MLEKPWAVQTLSGHGNENNTKPSVWDHLNVLVNRLQVAESHHNESHHNLMCGAILPHDSTVVMLCDSSDAA